MFLFFGKKRKLKNVGYVADFCPFCRSIQPFRIANVSMVDHLNGLPIGKGQTVAYSAKCCTCTIPRSVDVSMFTDFSEYLPVNIETLIKETYPDIRAVYAERLALENRLEKKQSLSSSERQFLLNEPIDVLASDIEVRYSGSTSSDKMANIGCLITMLVPAIIILLAICVIPNGLVRENIVMIAFIFALLGFLVTVVLMGTANARYLKTVIYPKLGRTYAPLKPTLEELETVLKRYRILGLMIGKKLKAMRIEEKTKDGGYILK